MLFSNPCQDKPTIRSSKMDKAGRQSPLPSNGTQGWHPPPGAFRGRRVFWPAALALAWLAAGMELSAAARPVEVKRTILALYDGREEGAPDRTRIHRFAEMPLNYLGFPVRYHDVRQGCPPPAEVEGIRGVLTWFSGEAVPDSQAHLEWLGRILDSGRYYALLGHAGVPRIDRPSIPDATPELNRLLSRIGIQLQGSWTTVTYQAEIAAADDTVLNFERRLGGVLAPYENTRLTDKRTRSHLSLRPRNTSGRESHLVVTHPAGGYAAGEYLCAIGPDADYFQWYLNPFEFFRLVFHADDLPKPDPTTLAGRRALISQIDGDGWNNRSTIEKYRKPPTTAAAVVQLEILEKYPDLLFTVAPIVADLEPARSGNSNARQTAVSILGLPHIEAGNHGYSHVLRWDQNATLDLKKEIEASTAYLNTLLSGGKRVRSFQWSGDTLPSGSALATTGQFGLPSINGGAALFEHPILSAGWVSPLSRPVGKLRQMLAGNGNESSYCDQWPERYFGLEHWKAGMEFTEKPRRLRPLYIYLHMIAGETPAALRAALDTLEYARRQETAPVTAADYARMTEGFFTSRILQLGDNRWQIENRGKLATFRWDDRGALEVDFSRSSGVLGERRFQGSLYVALDEADSRPVVALKRVCAGGQQQGGARLIQSRWPIWGFRQERGTFTFSARGTGTGEMSWQVSPSRLYRIRIQPEQGQGRELEARSDAAGRLALALAETKNQTITVQVRQSN